jgi:hypothetical protein
MLEMIPVQIRQKHSRTQCCSSHKHVTASFSLLRKADKAKAKQYASNHEIAYPNPKHIPRHTGEIHITHKTTPSCPNPENRDKLDIQLIIAVLPMFYLLFACTVTEVS